ncbi:hypothetical protein LCGC14_1476510 [marine sediment metagenome]|uniref:Uncharacterized protein n=1 Tax=marine sediment metagenome TaxID=412755 RepID=A0A0F9LRB2_9ZZZZ
MPDTNPQDPGAMPEPQSLEEAFDTSMEHIKTALAFVPYDDDEERRCAEENAVITLRNLALAENRALEEHLLACLDDEQHALVLLICEKQRARIAALGEGEHGT